MTADLGALHHLALVLVLLLAFIGLIFTSRKRSDSLPPYGLWGVLMGLSLTLYVCTPPASRVNLMLSRPPLLGREAGLRAGLWTQTQLPPRTGSQNLSWLPQTHGGRLVRQHPIVVFRPEGHFRRQGIERYFSQRYGWKHALSHRFVPQALVVHSTENQSEADTFRVFDQNTPAQYLGGVWTHFAVSPDGEIVQYGPLNRISKGQAGLDDLAIGIEIIGNASLWEQGAQLNTGSIMARWQKQERQQLEAVADLLKTLQQHYGIPLQRIYAHEDIGHVRDYRTLQPDMHWLRRQIRDRVYLGLEPTRLRSGQPERWYDFLEPYARSDPGRDVMQVLYQLLQT